ncbi:MAG: cysteine desulfurase [Firmicutes bacterium]|nr:cysteine desulfurase [Bacillota bacterium]
MKVYLDYNATTPVDPEVFAAMVPFLREEYGNPSSSHWLGQKAKKAVEKARQQVANLLECNPDEVVFTSGGSESNNFAIRGVAAMRRESGKGDQLITCAVEHPAVLNTCRHLEGQGFKAIYLPVDRYGMVDPDDVRRAVTGRTALITIMHANNEVGTIQPLKAIAEIAREGGISFHTDAAQSVGKVETYADELGVDLLTVAGHKLYAPKGVGALYIRRGTRAEPLIYGAGHEGGRRAGTENVAGVVGLGKACELAARELTSGARRLAVLRDRLYQRLLADVGSDKLVLNGHPEKRLPNTLNVSFLGVEGAALLARVPDIAASTGSACHADHKEASPVLSAMGITPDAAMGAVRLSLGRFTTEAEVDCAAELLVKAFHAGVSS